MSRIPEDVVQKVLDATDIVDLIGGHVQLKRAGATFKGLCPFHNEKTPSFNVSPQRQNYKCFGCGEGGSAIGWLMNYENLPFTDAVKKLAGRANIIIREEKESPEQDRARKARSRLVDLHNKTARFLHQLAQEHPGAQHARDYLQSRGFDQDMTERWLIGWMPDQDRVFFDWVKQNKFFGRDLVAAGLAGLRDENAPERGLFLRFKDRLMFPIHNDYGDVIAFSGRQLRDDPRSGKYVNSPETPLFKKAKVIFGLDKARKAMLQAKHALICEGQIDVIACHEAGIQHAVAGLGTAFTEDHARLLRRFTDHATLCYDADAAGIKASSRAFKELAKAGIAVKYAQMPPGEDPDTFIKQFGPESFRELIEKAPDFFDAVISAAVKEGTLDTPDTKANFAHELADLLKSITDTMRRDTLIQHVATRIQIGADDLRRTMLSVKTFKSRNRDEKEEKTRIAPTPVDRAIAQLIQYSITSPDVHEWLAEQGETLHRAADLPGASLLSALLIRPPLEGRASAVNAYLVNQSEADQLALSDLLDTEPLANPMQAATETLGHISDAAYQRELRALISEMENPRLTREEQTELMQNIANLRSALS